MIDDLHERVWLSYRRKMLADWSGDATEAFQAALDVYLGRYRQVVPAAACSAVSHMIAMRPRGVGGPLKAVHCHASESFAHGHFAHSSFAGRSAVKAVRDQAAE